MPDPIPIKGGDHEPQFLLRLAEAMARGEIEACAVVFSTKDSYQCLPLVGDAVTVQGLLSRAIHEANLQWDEYKF